MRQTARVSQDSCEKIGLLFTRGVDRGHGLLRDGNLGAESILLHARQGCAEVIRRHELLVRVGHLGGERVLQHARQGHVLRDRGQLCARQWHLNNWSCRDICFVTLGKTQNSLQKSGFSSLEKGCTPGRRMGPSCWHWVVVELMVVQRCVAVLCV